MKAYLYLPEYLKKNNHDTVLQLNPKKVFEEPVPVPKDKSLK